MRRRTSLLIMLAALTACSSNYMLYAGEGVRPVPDAAELEVRVVDTLGQTVEGAAVRFGSFAHLSTGRSGQVISDWPEQPFTLEVEASGYHTSSTQVLELPTGRVLDVVIEPVVLEGQVRSTAGVPLDSAVVRLNDLETISGRAGQFRFVRALAGEVSVSRPAYEGSVGAWDGEAAAMSFDLKPKLIRALRANGPSAGTAEVWDRLLTTAGETEINAMVVDIKDESGRVFHNTAVELAHEVGAVDPFYSAQEVVADLRERDLYAIARIVAFQDVLLGAARPDLAVSDAQLRAPWETSGGQHWLDATDRDSWEYLLDLAVEGCQLGFEEIQFDYVRFPTDGPVERAVFDGGNDQSTRVEAIGGFLNEARSRLNPLGCAVAADVFSVVLSAANDQGLGQRVEELSQSVDVLSPMIYPSHYSTGWFGYTCPNDFPGEVVSNALADGLPRIVGAAIVRPYLQDFTLGCGRSYGTEEVRIQIDAVEALDLGWILWNARSIFTGSALEPE